MIITIPIKLVSEANAHEHWRMRQRRAKAQRAASALSLRSATNKSGEAIPHPPLVVTITRVAPRDLDSDNLAGSGKHVRDGVADFLGINDRDARIEWIVKQERGAPKTYETRIEIREARVEAMRKAASE